MVYPPPTVCVHADPNAFFMGLLYYEIIRKNVLLDLILSGVSTTQDIFYKSGLYILIFGSSNITILMNNYP